MKIKIQGVNFADQTLILGTGETVPVTAWSGDERLSISLVKGTTALISRRSHCLYCGGGGKFFPAACDSGCLEALAHSVTRADEKCVAVARFNATRLLRMPGQRGRENRELWKEFTRDGVQKRTALMAPRN